MNDTFFMPDVGTARADFQDGNVKTLWHTICKILSLPQDMRLFAGYHYPVGSQPAWQTSVAEQRQNIQIKGHDEGKRCPGITSTKSISAISKRVALIGWFIDGNHSYKPSTAWRSNVSYF